MRSFIVTEPKHKQSLNYQFPSGNMAFIEFFFFFGYKRHAVHRAGLVDVLKYKSRIARKVTPRLLHISYEHETFDSAAIINRRLDNSFNCKVS